MTERPRFRSTVTVELVRCAASDADVVSAARVSTAGSGTRARPPEADAGLIRYLVRERHGSPFEHTSFTFFVQAPVFVFREFHRHRAGWSYNEESARYRELAPVFYLPPPGRPLLQTGKTGHYRFVPGTAEHYAAVVAETVRSCTQASESYRAMLDAGVAREVARGVLPVATYSSMYATCNARSLMHFLGLRVHDPDALHPSYPQREIQMVAERMEALFASAMPLTHRSFVDNGRVAP